LACTHHLALGGLFTPPSFVCLCTNATLRIDANSGSKHRVRDEQRVYVVTEDTYVALDLSSIPSNATITSATLSLWTSNDLSDNDRTIRVYRLKTAFDESSATWNESASGVSWQSAGASGTNDRESTDIGSVLVLANEADGTEKQISLNTTKLQEMVSGTFTNNGFIIIADTELNDRFNYKSSDASTASQRPKLVIQYTTSTPTPGPSPTPTNTPAGPTATPTRTPTPSQTPTVAPTTPPPSFQNATFVYDGDGKRVKSIINNAITTYFVGAHYEVTGSTVTKYYYAGSQRIAMRSGTWDFSNPVTGTLNFLLGDHLGSTSLTTDAAGTIVSEIRYKAWGTVRYATEGVPTKYQYTGQYSYESEFGLYFYNARWYDPVLSRFAQADSIIPEQTQGVQAWDRYAYTNNNPVRHTDPTGHKACDDAKNCNSNKATSKVRFPPNPFSYDTLTVGVHGILKELIGVDVDVSVVMNWKAVKEGDFQNLDLSLNVGSSISGGVSVEDLVGIEVYGNDGTVLEQSGFLLIGKDGEIPVNAGGCLDNVCASALYTLDTNDPDQLNGEGFVFGIGFDPAGVDLSADLIGGSDWVLYQKPGESMRFQIPFFNRSFLQTVPLLGQFIP
jgi:RHS repeat-associated protein